MAQDLFLVSFFMPKVKIKGKVKHFPYTKAGYKAAAKARRKKGK